MSLLFFLILVISTGGNAYEQPMFCCLDDCQKTNEEPGFSFRKIDDSGSAFDSVTLVGTRNSYDFNVENKICKSQSLTIERQFTIGIRAFHVKISKKIYGEYMIENRCGFTYSLLSTLVWQLSRLIDENDFAILYIEQENIKSSRELANLLDDLLRYSEKVRVSWDFRDSKYFIRNKILINITGFKFPLQHCTTVNSSETSIIKRWSDTKDQIIKYGLRHTQKFEKCLVIFLGIDSVEPTSARISGGIDEPFAVNDVNLKYGSDYDYDYRGRLYETGMNKLFANGWIASDFSFNIVFVDFPSQKMVNFIQAKLD